MDDKIENFDIYANVVNLRGTPYDFTLEFSTVNPPAQPGRAAEIVSQGTVRMGWHLAKSLLILLAERIEAAEHQTAPIPQPNDLAEKWERFLKATGAPPRASGGAKP